MKKTPIIASVVGLGILGSAYLGGLYVSSSKTMSMLRQLVDRENKRAGIEYAQLQEEKGLFNSTAHLIVRHPALKGPELDAQLVFHHGVFSTDIDGKLMLNPLFNNIQLLKDNNGLDISGHINTFGSKGNFLQADFKPSVKDGSARAAGENNSVVIRAEQNVDLDQSTLDKLHGVIAKGVNGQSAAGADGRGDGKESNLLLSMRVNNDSNSTNIDIPVLYQQNSGAVDVSMSVSLSVNGLDMLKPHGIDSIEGVSHSTNSAYKLGSYAGFNMLGTFVLPSSRTDVSEVKLGSISASAEVDNEGARSMVKVAALNMNGHEGPASMGPLSFKASMPISSYTKFMDDYRAWDTWPEANRLATQKKWRSYLPDLQVDIENIHADGYDDEGSAVHNSAKHIKLALTRDLERPVSHVALEMRDLNGSELVHGNITQLVTIDQSIIDTFMETIVAMQDANMKRSAPSEMAHVFEQNVLTLLQKSPRIELNNFQVSADNWPQVMNVSGAIAFQGDSLNNFTPLTSQVSSDNITAYFTASGLPDELIKAINKDGKYDLSNDKPITVEFRNRQLMVNGKQVN